MRRHRSVGLPDLIGFCRQIGKDDAKFILLEQPGNNTQ